MSSLETNKIAGAVIVTALTLMVIGTVGNSLVHPDEHAGPEVAAAKPESEKMAAAPAPKAAAPLEPIAALLASADVEKGKKVFKKCAACHSFDEGGPNKVGPNLWDTVNRQIAGVSGFGYSEVLQDMSGDTWTYENLSAFLADPKGWAPGTKMAFSGIKKADKLADLIAYLRSLSGSPAPLPE